MKSKRQISKEATRLLILEKTKELILKNGIIKTSTRQIADSCLIAHGTVFSHFQNREDLLSEVLNSELLRIAKEINSLKNEKKSFKQMLGSYLDLLAADEDLFVLITKEFPFLSKNIRKEIIKTESIVKKIFYKKVEKGIKKGSYRKTDPAISLSFLFGVLYYYLSRKELFVESGSVIKEKKKEIIATYLNYLKQ